MKRILGFCLVMTIMSALPSARGGTKEEIARLQSDVLTLQNQIRLLDKSFNDQAASLKGLLGQLNDQVGKSNQLLSLISSTLENQRDSGKSTTQTLLQEVRNLSSKVDDMGTRVSALAQQVSEVKVQSKSISQRRFQTLGANPESVAGSADAIFDEAYSDLIQGNYDLAIQGLTSFVNNFPKSEKCDDAQYYIGEAHYNDNKIPQAIAAFTRVLKDYPNGDKVASALYKRASAELKFSEKDNAAEDFKAVIQRFPNSPEASLSKSQLETLGIDISKPTGAGSPRRKP